jgi:Protein of unknown function (DUF2865)
MVTCALFKACADALVCLRKLLFMRCHSLIVPVCACLLLAGVPAQSAHAQSFFQKLFGWGSSQDVKSETPAPPKPVPSLGSFSRSSSFRSGQSTASDDDYDDASTGSFRTLCVRTCDGYYFPISSRASSRRFARDARQCHVLCGRDAKLFHLPKDSDDIKNMTATDGSSYGSLPKAFAYRKSLINGCSCKPMPWSISETARHEQYALIEALDKAQERNAELARIAAAASVTKDETSATIAAKTAETIDQTPFADARAANSTPVSVANLEAETAMPGSGAPPAVMGHLMPGGMSEGISPSTGLQPSANAQRPRRSLMTGPVKAQVKKAVQTASWFSAQPKYSWPGDAPARRR